MMMDWRECRAAIGYVVYVTMMGGLFVAAIAAISTFKADARDLGQWDGHDAAVRAWFEGLRQPDQPTVSCCGEADAYWADSYEVNGSEYVAIVTDAREDAPLGRAHIANGTRIPIPNFKIKWDKGNPTGHGWVFIGAGGVYCYLPPGGV